MITVDVTLSRGDFRLDASFTNGSGITALFGRSGSGKTTLIHAIAGLIRPERGRIILNGRALVDTDIDVFVPRHRRRIGLVFQDAQLFPHLSVRRNLLFGRWFSRRRENRLPVSRVVETLGIGHLLRRFPRHLSGGETQRVALGRALLAEPDLLLMDEPLASLDVQRKLEILALIERLRDEFAIPIVYVSHALEEVVRLASTVVVLEQGRVRATGEPQQVLGASLFAASDQSSRFDLASVLEATVGAYDPSYCLTALHLPAGIIWLTGRVLPPGRHVRIIIRATDVALARQPPTGLSIRTVLPGTVASVRADQGPSAVIKVELPGSVQLIAVATRKAVDDLAITNGSTVFALIKSVAIDERPLAAS